VAGKLVPPGSHNKTWQSRRLTAAAALGVKGPHMGEMMVIVFFGFLIFIGAYLIKYSRVLGSIVDYSNANSVDIFGARYKNLYHLYADISFMNELWKKGCHDSIDDQTLREYINNAHSMLRTQVYLGLVVVLIPLFNAIIKAST
jgi:hypothetical protein